MRSCTSFSDEDVYKRQALRYRYLDAGDSSVSYKDEWGDKYKSEVDVKSHDIMPVSYTHLLQAPHATPLQGNHDEERIH